MTRKSRYILLLIGFLVFITLAPIIVFYVKGQLFDFSTGSVINTGLLALRTDPTDVNIILDDQLKRKTSGDINFLLPKEYQISLKKDGYHDWNKRLTINSGLVTWANPTNSKIFLLKNSSASQDLAENVLDFYSKDSFLLYTTPQNVVVASLGEKGQSFALPKPVNKILPGGDDKNFILTDNQSTFLYLSSVTGKFLDLSNLLTSTSTIQTLSNGDVYALTAGQLYKINTLNKTKQLILPNVQAYYIQNNNLYYIQQKNGINSLYISTSPFTNSQLLMDNVPTFSNGQLFVTFEKQILLLADGNLYRANATMEKVADSVTDSNFDVNNSNLAIMHFGQFDYFNQNNLNFITRSDQELKNLIVKNNIGYAFYQNNSGINAIELDNRGSQNQYQLYQSKKLRKFIVDSSGQNILLLDGDSLKSLEIR